MAVSFLALVLLLVVLVVSLVYVIHVSGDKPAPALRGGDGWRLPSPSPRCLPLLGHLHLLGSLPHRALRSLSAVHGPVMLLWFDRVPTVVVSSAAAAEEVMRTRDLAFASRPRSVMAERLYGLRAQRGVRALRRVLAPGAPHLCIVHLLSPRRILSFRRVREQAGGRRAGRPRPHSGAGGAVVNLSELLIAYANTVVTRAVFGDDNARILQDDGDNRRRKMRKLFADFQELFGMAPMGELQPWLGWVWVDVVTGLEGKVRRTFEALDGVLEKVIEDHRRRRQDGRQMGDDEHGNGDHRGFVDVLLDVNETDKETGIQLDTIEIKGIILDMFVVGTDTMSTTIEWAMAELINHPQHMCKLWDEIWAAFDGTKHVSEDHLDKLHYLKAVVKKTL